MYSNNRQQRAKPPRHIAIMLDGNGRWAESRGLPRSDGHLQGYKAWADIGFIAAEMDIEFLTLFFLSATNFTRPKNELSLILELWRRYLQEVVPRFGEHDMRFKFIGDSSYFDEDTVTLIEERQKATENNKGMTLTVSAAYSGRWDILTAAQKFLANETRPQKTVSEDSIAQYLSTFSTPDPDLVIRPGGEKRLSDCWLWQIAQSELYFTDVMWPDFGREELAEAIGAYQRRDRRFGNVHAA